MMRRAAEKIYKEFHMQVTVIIIIIIIYLLFGLLSFTFLPQAQHVCVKIEAQYEC